MCRRGGGVGVVQAYLALVPDTGAPQISRGFGV